MTNILSRIFPSLRRSHQLACSSAEQPTDQSWWEAVLESDAAAMQRMVAESGFHALYRLCGKIERGYDAGKTMYDNGMTTLAEELTSSTGEIKQLIEQHARMQAILVGLHNGYDHFEVTGLECDDEYQVLKRGAAAIATDANTQVAHA